VTEPAPRETLPPAPVCPRHPDRESYVRCQRCERPVCPQCQRQAAVGVQCVDCVAEQSRGVREARTTFGGRVAEGRPVVTLTIIGLCVLAFVAQQLPGLGVTQRFAFVPLLAAEQPYRFITAAFLHSPSWVLHIAFNMYALWLLGPYLEHLFGRLRFAVLYLVSAFGGSVGFLLLAGIYDGLAPTATVGASGAVFGLFGAVVVANRRLGRQMNQILVVIAINGVIGFLVPGIAWQAHLGGLLTGAAVAAVLAYAPRNRRGVVQAVGVAAVVLVLVGLAAARLTLG
jgi:membrane associated rhomboid family serine protease